MDILNIKELSVLKVEGNEYDYLVTTECKESPSTCIKCFGHRLVKHSINERVISDVNIHGKRTKILLIHRRYKCKDCDYTFYQLLDSVNSDGKITKRLEAQLQKESLTRPFLVIAEQYGVSKMTVRRAFDSFVATKDEHKIMKAPRVIGIDEAHLNKTMRGVITDIENKKLIEILPNMYKSTVKEFIQTLEGYKDIEVATMDMASGYRYAMKELVPNVKCVIDKFHVVQYAQVALDRVRIDYKNSLGKADRNDFHKDKWLLQSNKEDLDEYNLEKRDEVLDKHEVLLTAYWFKEMVRDLYTREDKKLAYDWFYQLEKSVPDKMTPFKDLMKTYNKVKPEIFNYFDQPYTNAYTESVNKVLYGTQQPKKPEFGANGFSTLSKLEIVG